MCSYNMYTTTHYIKCVFSSRVLPQISISKGGTHLDEVQKRMCIHMQFLNLRLSLMQAVHTVTFELEKDVVEEQLDLWLQVCDGGWWEMILSVSYV